MRVEPYLSFAGDCEAALNFYVDAIGARIEALMHFSDAPPDAMPDCQSMATKVMHALVRIGDTVVMAADGRQPGQPGFGGFALTLTVADEMAAVAAFDTLGEGGSVTMPLAPTFFAHQFGMLTDKFGVAWMVILPRVCGEG
jgi:PhnB protein